jgi:hypothetical protein
MKGMISKCLVSKESCTMVWCWLCWWSVDSNIGIVKGQSYQWQWGWKQNWFWKSVSAVHLPWMKWGFTALFGATKWQTSFWWDGIIQTKNSNKEKRNKVLDTKKSIANYFLVHQLFCMYLCYMRWVIIVSVVKFPSPSWTPPPPPAHLHGQPTEAA